MSKAIPRGNGKNRPTPGKHRFEQVELEDLLTILSGGCPVGWTVTLVRPGQETVTKLATGPEYAPEA